MTGKVLEEPKKAYFSVSGNGFNSNFGGSTADGGGDEESGRRITFGYQLSILKRGTESNNALNSSIECSISKLQPKRFKQASKGSS